MTCQKQKATTYQQLVGQLPSTRVIPGPPFINTGVDYAGPVTLKMGQVRKPTYTKAYICIFVSFTVKAVHLELVTDLTAEAFIATLRRFILDGVIHGCDILTTIQTSFEANHDPRDLTSALNKHEIADVIGKFCTYNGVQWSFIPEHLPNFGSLWESTVKSAKRHLSKAIKGYALTYQQYTTVLSQIEAVLNSCPLVPADYPDLTGLEPLTLGHFLIGQAITALSDKDCNQ